MTGQLRGFEMEELVFTLYEVLMDMKPEDRPLIVCLPGTNRAYFSTL